MIKTQFDSTIKIFPYDYAMEYMFVSFLDNLKENMALFLVDLDRILSDRMVVQNACTFIFSTL